MSALLEHFTLSYSACCHTIFFTAYLFIYIFEKIKVYDLAVLGGR